MDEIATLGTEYAMLTREANTIWQEKEQLRSQMEAMAACGAGVAANPTAAAEELAWLKSSKSYRVMERYMHYMDHTAPGRLLSGIRGLIRRKH